MMSVHTEKSQLPELIPLHQLPALIPSSRPGKRLAIATVYRWAQQGRIRTVKIGGSRYVVRDALAQLFSAADSPSDDPRPETRGTDAHRAGLALDRLLRARCVSTRAKPTVGKNETL